MKPANLVATLLLAAAAATVSSADTPAPTGTSPQFPAEVALVTVDALVLDDDGNPMRGLTRDDFLITENGKPQTTATFEAIEARPAATETKEPAVVSTNVIAKKDLGRTFVVVFDGTHLTPAGALRVKPAIARFLRESVGENDTVTLLTTAGGVWWSGSGSRGRERLLRLLDGLRGERIDQMPHGVYITDDEAKRIADDRDALVASAVYKRLIKTGAIFDPSGGRSAPTSMTDGSMQRKTSSDWYTVQPEVEAYAQQLYQTIKARRAVTLQLLERVIDSLATKGGRKSVLLVSEGFVADAATPGYREVVSASRRANAAVYFLDARGLVVGGGDISIDRGQVVGENSIETAYLTQSVANYMPDLDADSAGADSLADETGGFSVKHTNDLGKGFDRVNRESAAYYLIGYYPGDDRRDGAYHKIGVTVSRKGAHVRARKGYYAPGPTGSQEQAKAKEKGKAKERDSALPALQRAFDAPFALESVPLRVSAYAFEPVAGGKANVVLATDVATRDLAFEVKGDRHTARLDYLVVIQDLDSGERVRLNEKIDMRLTQASRDSYARTWYPLLRDFKLARGTYEAKVVVMDEGDRRVGSVVHEFTVPDLTGLRVSSPILSDTLTPAKPGTLPLPMPLARRTFAGQGRLFCWFAVYGAARAETSQQPEVAAGFSLMSAAGREALRGEPAVIKPDAQGGLTRVIGIPLDGLAAGDYTLELTFEDRVAGKRVERREPLTIE